MFLFVPSVICYQSVLFATLVCTQCLTMIGYWHHLVVRPSVRLSVALCIVALRVGVHGYKLHQRVPSRHVPICPFSNFYCKMYRLATKCTTKKRSEKRHKCGLRLHEAYELKAHGSLVNNDTLMQRVPCRSMQQTCAACGRTSALIVGYAD